MIMTTEQKVNAYDEALERANAIYTGKYKPEVAAFCKMSLEAIFPELKNSEDERIRKALVNHLRNLPDYDTYDGIPASDMLAWLEKQKPAKWSEEDENMLNDIILDLKILKHKDAGKEGKAAYQKEIDWLQSLSPNQK